MKKIIIWLLLWFICIGSTAWAGRMYYNPTPQEVQLLQRIVDIYSSLSAGKQQSIDQVLISLQGERSDGTVSPAETKKHDIIQLLIRLINREKEIQRLKSHQGLVKSDKTDYRPIYEGPLQLYGTLTTQQEEVCSSRCINCFVQEGCESGGAIWSKQDVYYLHVSGASDELWFDESMDNLTDPRTVRLGALDYHEDQIWQENLVVQQHTSYRPAHFVFANAQPGTVATITSLANTSKSVSIGFLKTATSETAYISPTDIWVDISIRER